MPALKWKDCWPSLSSRLEFSNYQPMVGTSRPPGRYPQVQQKLGALEVAWYRISGSLLPFRTIAPKNPGGRMLMLDPPGPKEKRWNTLHS